MLDPSGDAPWEEDPAAKNVVQVSSEKVLLELNLNLLISIFMQRLYISPVDVLFLFYLFASKGSVHCAVSYTHLTLPTKA